MWCKFALTIFEWCFLQKWVLTESCGASCILIICSFGSLQCPVHQARELLQELEQYTNGFMEKKKAWRSYEALWPDPRNTQEIPRILWGEDEDTRYIQTPYTFEICRFSPRRFYRFTSVSVVGNMQECNNWSSITGIQRLLLSAWSQMRCDRLPTN